MGSEILGRLVEIMGGPYDGEVGRCFSINRRTQVCGVKITTESVLTVNQKTHFTHKVYNVPYETKVKVPVSSVRIWTQPTV